MALRVGGVTQLVDGLAAVAGAGLQGHTIRGDIRGHLMLAERIASQSEVIRAIVSGCSPCCEGPAPAGW